MRRGISRRVLTVVAVVATALLGCAVGAGALALSRVRAGIADERTALARAVALETERLLDGELERLATVAVAVDGDPGELAGQLHAAYRDARLLDLVFVAGLDGDGPVLVQPSATPLARALLDEARQLAAGGRPGVRARPGGGALFVLPARSRDDRIVGVVGGVMPARPADLARLLDAIAPAPNGWIDLRDADGSTAIRAGAGPPAQGVALVEAGAPVGPVGWTVRIAQPERDALGGVASIQRWTLVAVPLILGVTLLLTWGATASVVRPLQELTVAAEAIAGGNLDCTIAAAGRDEAGRLARAFDDMRRALKQSVRRALLEKTLTAQEDERRRISRELHDETSQTANALLMRIDAALAGGAAAVDRAAILHVRELAVRLLDGVHRLILALRPSLLDDLGLFAAIEWFARDQLAPLGITVHVETSDPDVRLPRDIELALFRVAQETITNIGRHSRADTALVECAVSEDGVTIDVEDDGEGFEMAELADRPAPAALGAPVSQRGLGLAGMRERVALVGGRIAIESSPGSGTHIRIAVPLPKEALLHV